ncbi:Zinc finger RING/FYVE/PHD-type protein [Dioscorea alata]|uniref:Zinc finger RING/FYVE/PHD-type protein n=1 Tax=Dioscorea alata TaxID=55571 RepID=A0ACB7U1A3_DIOAL|nr:Zinc finger RING/FYVE/PHD-type protein [Dioscorea alata]
MASKELDLAHPRTMDNGLSSRIGFQDPALQFPRAAGNHTADDRSGGFFRMGQESRLQNRDWNTIRDPGSSGDGSEDDDEDGYDDEEDEGLVSVDNGNHKHCNNSSGSVQSSSDKACNARADSQKQHSCFGLNRGMVAKDGSGMRGSSGSQQPQEQGREGGYDNEITIVEPENYYTPIMHGGDGSSLGHKEIGGEPGCGFGGRRESALAIDLGESLRTHLSDPVTGALMDDAMILPCGHSFGSGGMQQVYRMKSCFKCSQPISEDLVRPNLALRAAVQAFHREEESQFSKAPKRRRDRFEHEKCSYDDPFPLDLSRGKGVQFPFVVSDRVIIKGNKRTPQRFVGRVAVVTTQCLNGWYVVKTLDNAESVKLQYRSLAKFTDELSSNVSSNKVITPNWL